MDIEGFIIKHYGSLSENDLHIWRYISNHREEVSELSISDLAKKCAVSRTTIMRFAQKIGLTGYSELKTYLRWEESRTLPTSRSIVAQVCENNIRTIKHYETMDFSEISSTLYHAKNIFIYGTGSTQREVAIELQRNLLSVSIVTFALPGEGELIKSINLLGEGDVLFAISKSGETDFLLEKAKLLKGKGVKIISLTSNKNNRLASISDFSLSANIEKFELKNRFVYETMVQMFLVIEILSAKFIDKYYL
jgi:Transcriptional regulators